MSDVKRTSGWALGLRFISMSHCTLRQRKYYRKQSFFHLQITYDIKS